MKAIDETGNIYEKLTVLHRDPNSKKRVKWICQCECGNKTSVDGSKLRNGETRSCGCLRKEKAKNNAIDITGLKYGHLTVVSRNGSTPTGLATWNCFCDCGNPNNVIVTGGNLRSGHTTSCGCVQKEAIKQMVIEDISNQRFGKLVAIKRLDKKQRTNHIWLCQCDCGNWCEVSINYLTQHRVSSCGCLFKSRGEFEIEELLKQHSIKYIREKTFENCRFPDTNQKARFDFWIEEKYLIEFDGEQHFQAGNSEKTWNNKEHFFRVQLRDKFKNNWCKENNIPLIRIPYTHLDNLRIEDLQLKTSNFII